MVKAEKGPDTSCAPTERSKAKQSEFWIFIFSL